MINSSDGQGASARGKLTRREVLEYGAVGLVVMATPALSAQSNAQRNLDLFMAVSRRLTGKHNLSPITSERIFLAMGGHKRPLLTPLESLAGKIEQAPSNWSEKEQALAANIIRAWYLGQVGDGPDAEVITYEHSLMYAAVSDVLEPRTFCAAEPGSWASKPA